MFQMVLRDRGGVDDLVRGRIGVRGPGEERGEVGGREGGVWLLHRLECILWISPMVEIVE